MSRSFIDRPVFAWVVAIVLMLAGVVAVLTQAGQRFYKIDRPSYEAILASAQAALLHAHASVKTAQSIVSRYRPLAAACAVSWQDLGNVISTLEQNQSDVASTQAAVKTAGDRLIVRVTPPWLATFPALVSVNPTTK